MKTIGRMKFQYLQRNLGALILTLLILSGTIFSLNAQQVFSTADSAYFANIKDDPARLQVIVDSSGNSRMSAVALNLLGLLDFKSKHYDDAAKKFSAVRENFPSTPEGDEALYFLARIDGLQKNLTQSKTEFGQYIEREPHGYWIEGASYFYVKVLLALDDSSAVSQAGAFLNQFPTSFYAKDAQFLLVRYYRDRTDYGNAIIEARKLLDHYPSSTYANDLQYQIGEYYYRLGSVENAEHYFQALVDTSQPNTERSAIGQYLLAELYEKDHQYDKARAEYMKVRQNNPSVANWVALSEYAEALSFREQAQEQRDTTFDAQALSSFSSFIKNHPTDKRTPRALIGMAQLYEDHGQFDNAVRSYDMLASFDTTTMSNISSDVRATEMTEVKKLKAQAHLAKALLLRNSMKNIPAALAEYQSLLSTDSTNEEALLGKGISLHQLNRDAEADSIFVKLKGKPDDAGKAASQYLEHNN